MNDLYVIGYRTTSGMVQPIAIARAEVSKSRLKRVVSKFRKEPNFVSPCQMVWSRLYDTKREAISDLPVIK